MRAFLAARAPCLFAVAPAHAAAAERRRLAVLRSSPAMLNARGRLAAVLVAAAWFSIGLSRADPESDCRGFIPERCCCTNQCCWEIRWSEVAPVTGTQWRIVATGQVIEQTGFSPDGKWWRCACDLTDDGQWLRHEGANTRCLFVPRLGS